MTEHRLAYLIIEQIAFTETKSLLVNSLVNMDSIYFDGLWSRVTNKKSKKIKSLWYPN